MLEAIPAVGRGLQFFVGRRLFMLLPVQWLAVATFLAVFISEKWLLRGRRVKTRRDWDRNSLKLTLASFLFWPSGVLVAYGTTAGRIGRAPTMLLGVCGISLIVVGAAVRWTAVRTLKGLFTVNVSILEGHTIVKSGLYKHLRHPSYTGLLLRHFGLALALANWLSMLIIVVPVTAALLYRIRVEERALREAFGSEYEAYSLTTKRLIPKLY